MSPPAFIEHFGTLASGYDAVLSDVWGVVHNGERATPQACEAVSEAMPASFYFASRGLVLPAGQNGGLPVVTVNTPEVDVQFLRIKPESLSAFLEQVGGRRVRHNSNSGDEEGDYYYDGYGDNQRRLKGTVGGWVLSMRGMGVTIQGEDYVVYAEHKGLSHTAISRDYYLRNALLPQVTGLALALGTAVTNGLLVETLFGLPGLGTTLNQALRANDYMVIYGIVLFIIIAVASLMAVVEVLYPLLAPRVRQG